MDLTTQHNIARVIAALGGGKRTAKLVRLIYKLGFVEGCIAAKMDTVAKLEQMRVITEQDEA